VNVNNRLAVVTGGAQGIGRRTAELLAQRGYNLAIIDHHQPVETLKAIEANRREALGYSGDVTQLLMPLLMRSSTVSDALMCW
jgi:NAD(P)-dependent dehydrogenase (short-subunit alcohol dehydrogenase family)